MIAASAPENGVSVEWAWDIIEEPSFGEYKDAGRRACACSITGDCGGPPVAVASAIMGEAEPIEPRREVRAVCLRLARRTRRSARTPTARIAKVPRTTMVAIPQWGNSDRELGCKLAVVWVAAFLELEAASAAETEAADDNAIAADDEEAMDDVTASASVVSAGGMVYSRGGSTIRNKTHELR